MSKCQGCVFKDTYTSMGVSVDVCVRQDGSLQEGVSAATNSESCQWRITRQRVREIQEEPQAFRVIPKQMIEDELDQMLRDICKGPRELVIYDDIENSGWISFEERCPEGDMDVLAAVQVGDRVRVTICKYIADFEAFAPARYEPWIIDSDSVDGYEVTHWMPLPEPPKMEGGAE